MRVNPLRLAAALLLAACVAYGSYQVVKPHTFSYVKLREGVVKGGGMPLAEEDVEEAVLVLGSSPLGSDSPIAGLIPWSEVETYVGQTLARQVTGGLPLLKPDMEIEGRSSLEQPLAPTETAMSVPVDNILGVTPHIAIGERVHLYASFEDEEGSHSGLLLRDMPVVGVQREQESDAPRLEAVTIALSLNEAVLLTHALHYGKVRLGRAGLSDGKRNGIGDESFAAALMRTRKRWNEGEEVNK
jgi:pilus assembly protein CpaB